ncbi:MAG TPA: hypothetical protein VMV49_06910 [Candidatus Deferrimicrobium sp.]|nr:hypothetical protein [Candidatus Deferrimicrobium sp.]
MSDELEFSANIIKEILDFMQKDITEITVEIKEEKLDRVENIISELKNLPQKHSEIQWPKRLERFGKLDPAQKAFVILATADKELDFSTLIEKGTKIETIIKISYLKEVRWFSQVSKKVEEIVEGKENIRKYLEKNPKLKRIGCGNFAKNFPNHVFNLLSHLLYPKLI